MDLLKKLGVGLFMILVYLAMAVGLIIAVTYCAGIATDLLGIELLIQKPELVYEAATAFGFIFLVVVLMDHFRKPRDGRAGSIKASLSVACLLGLGIVTIVIIGLGIARLLMTYTDPMFALAAGHFMAAALLLVSWVRIYKVTRPVGDL